MTSQRDRAAGDGRPGLGTVTVRNRSTTAALRGLPWSAYGLAELETGPLDSGSDPECPTGAARSGHRVAAAGRRGRGGTAVML